MNSIRRDHAYPRHSDALNIAAIAPCTQALGPGTHAAVWVQGCPLHCPGCLAPNWIPFVAATVLTPEAVFEKLDLEGITGMTFSGGEPMEQASGLATLIRLARGKKDLNLICFTGYRYEHLLKYPPNAGVPELLAAVDVLIDGPFVQSMNNSVGLRGSSNQRAIHLTSKLDHYDFKSSTRKVELTISDGELAFIGIPTPGILSAINSTEMSGERMEQNERV